MSDLSWYEHEARGLTQMQLDIQIHRLVGLIESEDRANRANSLDLISGYESCLTVLRQEIARRVADHA